MKITKLTLIIGSILGMTTISLATPLEDQAKLLYVNLKNGKSTEAIYTYCKKHAISAEQIGNEAKKICEANNDWDTYSKVTETAIAWKDRMQSISRPVKIIAALSAMATGVCIWLLYKYLKKPGQEIPPVVPPIVHPQPRPNSNYGARPRPNSNDNDIVPPCANDDRAPKQPARTSAKRSATRNTKNAPIAYGHNFGREFGREYAPAPRTSSKARTEKSNAAQPSTQSSPRVQQPAPAPAERANATNRKPDRIMTTQRVFETLMADRERERAQEEEARAASRMERERTLEQIRINAAQERLQTQARINALAAENERKQALIRECIDTTRAENKQFEARWLNTNPLDHNDVATFRAESERHIARNQARIDAVKNQINQNNNLNNQDDPK